MPRCRKSPTAGCPEPERAPGARPDTRYPVPGSRLAIPWSHVPDADAADLTPVDPRPPAPRRNIPQEPIAPPGLDSEMNPAADHGETSYKGLGRLVGRKALITGGDSGIGRAVAIAFAREGADVLISHLPEEESPTRASRVTGSVKPAASPSRCLATSSTRTTAAASWTWHDAGFGGLDIVVNNAAYQVTHDDLEEFTTEELDRSFRTNVYAMFWICRAALPRLAGRRQHHQHRVDSGLRSEP